MAVVLVCSKMNCKGQTIPISKEYRLDQGCFQFSRMPKVINHLRSSASNASKRGKLCIVFSEKQLRCLDSYFGKLKSDVSRPSSRYLNGSTEILDGSGQSREEKGLGSVNNSLFKSCDRSGKSEAEEELGSLNDYLAIVNKDAKSKDYVSPASYMESKSKGGQGGLKNSSDETSDICLISVMVSINITVFISSK